MTPSTLAILTAARKLIERPEQWAYRPGTYGWNDRECCVTAFQASELDAKLGLVALGRAIGATCGAEIIDWNDAPERTHAEVLAAFDAAIAAEQMKQGDVCQTS